MGVRVQPGKGTRLPPLKAGFKPPGDRIIQLERSGRSDVRERELTCAAPFGEITSIESPLRSATILSTGLLCFCRGIIIITPSGRSHASKYEPPMILSSLLQRSHPNV